MERTLIAKLAEYASTLRYEDLPEEVVEKAKICILDTLAVAMGGYEMDSSRVAIRTVKLLTGPGSATLWFDGHRGRAIDCALANSVMSHAALQDDWHPPSRGHIAVAVVPTLFALAEEGGQSGRDAILATVLGYEVEGRVGALSVPASLRGFRPSALYSHFGSAATAAKLMRLPAAQFKNALACAGSMAGGIQQPWIDGSMEWSFQEGSGCRTGILAVLLAQQGLQGADNILEGPRGVNASFAGTTEGQAEILRGLGEQFQILDVCFKPFPSGGANQGSMTVAQDLARRNPIDYRKVRAVRIQIPQGGTHERMDYPTIRYAGPFHTIDQCLISKPFGIAAILKNGFMDMDVARQEQPNPEIGELARKVQMEEVTGISGWSLRMEVEMEDGTLFQGGGSGIDQSLIYLNRDRAAEKFLQTGSHKLGSDRAHQVVEMVLQLDKLDGVSPIVERLTYRPSGRRMK